MPQPRTVGRKALEVNPWFNYYVMRDGRNRALYEALMVGRETMTEPNGTCGKVRDGKRCTEPLWFRPLVGCYTCYVCDPGRYAG